MSIDEGQLRRPLDHLRQRLQDATAEETTWEYTAPTPDEVAEFYNRYNRLIAQFYGGNMHYGYWDGPDDDSTFEEAGARLTDIMIDKLGVKPGDRILDLGCGPGKPAVRLAHATGASVVGVSISTMDVELANERARAEGVSDRVRFQCADANDLPFEAGSFDAVLALESIVHIEDRAHVLAQIARVLRPGGRVALTDFVKRGPDIDDEEARAALDNMLAAWRAAPLVRAEDYPGFAERAGLVIDEIVDITDNTKYTFPRTYSMMREYAEQHDDLPPELAEMVAESEASDWAIDEDVEQTEGCVIVVAHLP